VITPPALLVDTLVALSIVYVGLDNILRNTADAKGRITASGSPAGSAGHGFAFATNLREAGFPKGRRYSGACCPSTRRRDRPVTIAAAAFPLLLLWKRSTEQRQRYGGMPWTRLCARRRPCVIARW
jgi:hypothetical protein